jgi:hypothetical protein
MMKRACWVLFLLSVLVALLGAISRFGPAPLITGVGAGTFWKAAMALLAYAVALKILAAEGKTA